MVGYRFALATALIVAPWAASRAAEPVMVQCGRDYQAARSAGTLNGMDWAAYRTACAARLKAPAAAVPLLAATPAAVAAPGAPAAAPSSGMAAMHARQKLCGAEWTAGKVALVAQTPGLTWPKYWSQCNARLKAAGR